MNLKGLRLRLKTLINWSAGDFLSTVHEYANQPSLLHVKVDGWWYIFQETDESFVVDKYTPDDFVHNRNPELVYRGNKIALPTVLGVLGLRVSPEAGKLAG